MAQTPVVVVKQKLGTDLQIVAVEWQSTTAPICLRTALGPGGQLGKMNARYAKECGLMIDRTLLQYGLECWSWWTDVDRDHTVEGSAVLYTHRYVLRIPHVQLMRREVIQIGQAKGTCAYLPCCVGRPDEITMSRTLIIPPMNSPCNCWCPVQVTMGVVNVVTRSMVLPNT